MVVVGGIIGGGIFINPYIVAERLPSAALVLAAWVIGGGIALAGAFAFAELGSLFPEAGGQYVYLRRAFHPVVGFLFGWALLFMIEGGAMAAIAITFAEYTLRFLGRDGATAPLAVGAIALVALVNFLGVKPGSRLLNVFVVLKLLALGILIAAGALVPAGATPAAPGPATSASSAFLPVAVGAALIPIMFSYGGWQKANQVAEEIRRPQRDLPLAIVAGTVLVVVVYLLVNVAYLRALGRDGLAATHTPAADTARLVFGSRGDRLIALGIAISTFGFLNLSALAPTRVYFAMAADGVFFRSVARLHPRFRTPSVAIGLQAVWAIALTLTGTFAQLVDTVVFADWIFFGLTAAAVFVFRRRIPLAERAPGSFRTPGHPVLPALFVAAALVIVGSTLVTNPLRSLVGALLLASGLPAWAWWHRRAGSSPGAAP
jgi:APA family basic amino acid/polyamine antiporter